MKVLTVVDWIGWQAKIILKEKKKGLKSLTQIRKQFLWLPFQQITSFITKDLKKICTNTIVGHKLIFVSFYMLLIYRNILDIQLIVYWLPCSFCFQSFLYLVWYLVMSMLGHYNNFFFAAHLLDIAMGVKTLRTILSSVTHNGKQVWQQHNHSFIRLCYSKHTSQKIFCF